MLVPRCPPQTTRNIHKASTEQWDQCDRQGKQTSPPTILVPCSFIKLVWFNWILCLSLLGGLPMAISAIWANLSHCTSTATAGIHPKLRAFCQILHWNPRDEGGHLTGFLGKARDKVAVWSTSNESVSGAMWTANPPPTSNGLHPTSDGLHPNSDD